MSSSVKVLKSEPKPEGGKETLQEAIKTLEAQLLESNEDSTKNNIKRNLIYISKAYYGPVRMSTGTVYDSEAIKQALKILQR